MLQYTTTFRRTRLFSLGFAVLFLACSADKDKHDHGHEHPAPVAASQASPVAAASTNAAPAHSHDGVEHTHPAEEKKPEEHHHDAPHGGQVADLGDRHLELLVKSDGHIDVFVLDGNAKPASAKNAQGKVKLVIGSGVKEFPLTYDEAGNHLTAMAATLTEKKLIALVDLVIDGKPYSARFDNELGGHNH